MELQSIKNCPICGYTPVLESHDMGTPNGHGYPGSIGMTLRCPYCKLPEVSGANSITMPIEKVFPAVVAAWNKEVDRVQNFLDMNKKKTQNH